MICSSILYQKVVLAKSVSVGKMPRIRLVSKYHLPTLIMGSAMNLQLMFAVVAFVNYLERMSGAA